MTNDFRYLQLTDFKNLDVDKCLKSLSKTMNKVILKSFLSFFFILFSKFVIFI